MQLSLIEREVLFTQQITEDNTPPPHERDSGSNPTLPPHKRDSKSNPASLHGRDLFAQENQLKNEDCPQSQSLEHKVSP